MTRKRKLFDVAIHSLLFFTARTKQTHNFHLHTSPANGSEKRRIHGGNKFKVNKFVDKHSCKCLHRLQKKHERKKNYKRAWLASAKPFSAVTGFVKVTLFRARGSPIRTKTLLLISRMTSQSRQICQCPSSPFPVLFFGIVSFPRD